MRGEVGDGNIQDDKIDWMLMCGGFVELEPHNYNAGLHRLSGANE